MRPPAYLITLLLSFNLFTVLAEEVVDDSGFKVVIEHAPPPPEDDPPLVEDTELPDPLTIDNFDDTLSKDYHFVEFFSPYCHHCKELAPRWKEFYLKRHEKYEKLSITMNQVDCVASGDLCARESIIYYPMLRFYGPGGKLISSFAMQDYERDTTGFSKFLDDQLLEINDVDSESGMSHESLKLLKTHNRMIESEELVRVIGGLNEKPILLSFWPSTNKDLNPPTFYSDFSHSELFKECPRCFEFRNIWSKLMKNLVYEVNEDNTLEFGYVNCKSNRKVCNSLGMDDMINGDVIDYDPKIFMFLPTDKGGNKIRYKSSTLSTKKLSNWTRRLLDIYKFEDIPFKDLNKKVNLSRKLPKQDYIADLITDPKVAFVYLYDEKTHVPEDDFILSHLIQPIMDIERNVYLYKSSDYEKYLSFIENQEMELVNNYMNEFTKAKSDRMKFDNEMFTAKTLSTLPMVIALKENSLLSPVYQSFSSRDTRDFAKLMDFIKINSEPTFEELNAYTRSKVFPKFKESIYDKSEKVLVAVVDDNDHKDFFKKSYFLTFFNQSFNYLKQVFQYKKLKGDRQLKREKVEKLKSLGSENEDIIKELKKKVNNVFIGPEFRLTTVYISRGTLMFTQRWWPNLKIEDYDIGDAFIVSRFNNRYWDNDGQPYKLTDVPAIMDGLNKAFFEDDQGKKLKDGYDSWFGVLKLVFFSALLLLALKKLRKSWLLRRSSLASSVLPVHSHNSRLPLKSS